ncbi:MAG: endopeptidase La, partial [Proteobacteria bacterium]|nr:endopeptidase La [Pseudomonadota bacterium]
SIPLIINRPQSVQALNMSGGEGNKILIVAQKEGFDQKSITPSQIYKYGTLAEIEKIQGNSESGFQVVVHGLNRIKLIDSSVIDGALFSTYELADDIVDCDADVKAVLASSIKDMGMQILSMIPADTKPLEQMLEALDDLNVLIPMCMENLDIEVSKKQEVLETLGVKARALMTLELMAGQKQQLEVQVDIGRRINKKMGKQQREAILRQQLAAIQSELGGDSKNDSDEDGGYVKKIEDAKMPENVTKIALDEARRLESIGTQSPESHLIRNYLDLLLALPWNVETTDNLDINTAKEILTNDHFGLEKVKTRIIQHLAVMKLRKGKKGNILLLVGPPGVGKTSLGESIARTLNRKFVRVSLGGVRDDAEIRGHRKTYVGAMPGRVIQGLKRSGVKNPVFLLDEIDKMGRGYGGDPAAALLEVLDPEQNSTFSDHYLDVPFDLSSVFFIATANSLEGIPGPLLDRMEVIELSGYTTAEKLHIAKRHIFPKQILDHGLADANVTLTDSALLKVILGHTREAGVRDLQRKIQMICRWAAERILSEVKVGEQKLEQKNDGLQIDSAHISEIMGHERFQHDVAESSVVPGVVTGLAWTPMGGDILFIEASQMQGSGRLTLTGQLGDVMKESAQIALSLVRSHLGPFLKNHDFEKRDIHIHVPSGSVPKDGPSAGAAILTTLASLLTGIRVNSKIAMTGEITLRGAVTPVGGIKEKVLAAHRAGIEHVILPKKNEPDLKDVPSDIRDQMRISFVENVNELIELVLGMHDLFAPLALPAGLIDHPESLSRENKPSILAC